MATHSSTLAWKIPWTEEPGGLQSMRLHRVGHDWSDLAAAAAAMYVLFPFLHSVFCFWNLFKLLNIVIVSIFYFLCCVLFHCTNITQFIYAFSGRDIWIASWLGLLRMMLGTNLAVQWLPLAFECKGCGLDPWWGAKIPMPPTKTSKT